MGNALSITVKNDIDVPCDVRIWESTPWTTHEGTVPPHTTQDFHTGYVWNATEIKTKDGKLNASGYGSAYYPLYLYFTKDGKRLPQSDSGALRQGEEHSEGPRAKDLPQDQLQRYVELGGASEDNLSTINRLACSVFPTGQELEQLKRYIEQGVNGEDDRATIINLASQVFSKRQGSPLATGESSM